MIAPGCDDRADFSLGGRQFTRRVGPPRRPPARSDPTSTVASDLTDGHTARMHPCPCCGYRTLESRFDYELCPVCWWEDDGAQPWEVSGPNNQTLLEAQQEFLRDSRPFRRREGKVRAPRRREVREPGWAPFELDDEMRTRLQRGHDQHDREMRDLAREVEANVGQRNKSLDAYNTEIAALNDAAPNLDYGDIIRRARDIGRKHDFVLPELYLELTARRMQDPSFYRRHPGHALWWLVCHSRPGCMRRRWNELRTGHFTVAG